MRRRPSALLLLQGCLQLHPSLRCTGYEEIRDELARSNKYNLQNEAGWYIVDKLRQLPYCGKWLDQKARYYFSTARLKRRVNRQSERLKAVLRRRGVKISSSGAAAGIHGSNMYEPELSSMGEATEPDPPQEESTCSKMCWPFKPLIRYLESGDTARGLPDNTVYGQYGQRILRQVYPPDDHPLARRRVAQVAADPNQLPAAPPPGVSAAVGPAEVEDKPTAGQPTGPQVSTVDEVSEVELAPLGSAVGSGGASDSDAEGQAPAPATSADADAGTTSEVHLAVGSGSKEEGAGESEGSPMVFAAADSDEAEPEAKEDGGDRYAVEDTKSAGD